MRKSSETSIAINPNNTSPLLQEFASRQNLVAAEEAGIILTQEQHGIELLWKQRNAKALKFHIQLDKALNEFASFPAPKQGAFNQAIGKRSKTVLDTTAGWGGDSMLLCVQGYKVTMLERNPVMALLLKDAVLRLNKSRILEGTSLFLPEVIEDDAIKFVVDEDNQFDCIYLDPMFPSKRKKTAATNKYMTLLQAMVGVDVDSEELLTNALNHGHKRVVVKRPNYADPIVANCNERFTSKLVCYDIYLRS